MEENKEQFVKELGELYKKHNIENVAKMEYEFDGMDEFVVITYLNGYTKKVCVTLDSLAAINFDVLRGIF